MSRGTKLGRAKLSTTIDARNYEYLQSKVAAGEAANLAEALDTLLRKVRRLENRLRLSTATSEYFDNLDSTEVSHENALSRDLSSEAARIDFDQEL